MVTETKDEIDVTSLMQRISPVLYGHEKQQQVFVKLNQSENCCGWILGGPKGIGKATFAMHAARFLLGDDKPNHSSGFFESLGEGDRLWQRMILGGHLDFFLLRPDEKTKSSSITIDAVREVLRDGLLSHHESRHKVLLIDSLEDMTLPARQILLKTLEEPPRRMIILIISHAPSRALATILSRCRRLMFRPLPIEDFTHALTQSLNRPKEEEVPDAELLYQWSMGSLGTAHHIIRKDYRTMIEKTWDFLKRPQATINDARTISNQWSSKDDGWHIIMMVIERYLYHYAHAYPAHHRCLFDAWDEYLKISRTVQSLHLHRGVAVFLILRKMNALQRALSSR